MAEKTFEINLSSLKKHWVLLSLLAIFILSFYIRTYSFHYDYLLNIDSYYSYRYINFIVENGAPPSIDYYMQAPEGQPVAFPGNVNLYHYLGAYSFLAYKMFFPGTELWRFLIYFPAILASLMVIPAYYIGKTIYDKRAGVFLAFLVAFNSAIFMRTLGGDPDTDAIVMLLPLCVVSLFLLSQKFAVNEKWPGKKSLAFAAASGVFLSAFAFTWVGYWYIFFLLAGFVISKVVVEAVFSYIKKENPALSVKANLPSITSLLLMILVFVLLTTPIFGPGFLLSTFNQPLASLSLKSEESAFPNVYVSVQELMAGGDIKEVVQRAGTYSFFLTFIVCLPYIIITYAKNRKHLDTAIIITLWSVGALFATMAAVRFSILLAIPLCMGTAIVLAKSWRMMLGEDKEIFE